MSVLYMQQTATDFFERIEQLEGTLKSFSIGIDGKRSQVIKKLNQFKEESLKINKSYTTKESNKEKNPVHKAVIDTMNYTQESILNWEENVKRNAEGYEFMNKNEKHLLVMIFGPVKVGKSSLGNFIAGESYLKAAFDNIYKHKKHPEFCNEKKGREGNIITDEKGMQWFATGIKDTTGAIQYFTISGLRWIDSPGTGALKREGDTLSMEDMVNDYVNYADMGIFLMNSSEPGLRDDMVYIEKMQNLGKETVVLLTQSDIDIPKEPIKFLSNGELETVTVSKTKEDRRQQEMYVMKEIKNTFHFSEKFKQEHFKILSISTQLAERAICEQDDELFKQSNLDQFMKLIADKASDNAITLKEKNPKQNLNYFIDTIIHGSHSSITNDKSFIGIESVEEALQGVKRKSQGFKREIESRSERLTQLVSQEARVEFQKAAKKWEEEVNESNKTLNNTELSARLNKILTPLVYAALNKEIGKVITNFQVEQKNLTNVKLNLDIHKEFALDTETYYEYVNDEDHSTSGSIIGGLLGFALFGPVGGIIGGGLGHEAGSSSPKKVPRTRTKKRDLGTNVDDFVNSNMGIINSCVREYVKKELTNIANSYFEPQEKYADALNEKLEALKTDLSNLKYEY